MATTCRLRFVSSSKFALNRAPKLFLIFSSTVRKARRSDAALVILFLLTVLSSGCISAHRTPNLENIFAEARTRTGKRPVIVIPGILGSELINSKTGEVVWPSAFRTSEDGLPMTPNLEANHDDLVPGKIIETVRLARALPEVYVYRDLLEALRHYAGYREADWNNPGADGDKDSFYVFAYDWRRDNVENARELVRRIERLKATLHRDDLKFNVIAHSMGGLIARYAAMYGDQELPQVDAPLQPAWSGAQHISKIVMIGVPNEGSADAFATLIAGYSITEGLRRRVPLLNKLTAEDAVRTPAVFQLMPHAAAVRFLDEALKPLPLDLYDAEVWKRYGWSPIYTQEFRRRYTNHKSDSPMSEADLDGYLAAMLKRARRFHEALDTGAATSQPVALLAIGGDCEETLNSPVVYRDEKANRWVTLIRPHEFKNSSGQKVSKRQLTEAMYAPGDGRVTRKSLLGENVLMMDGHETVIRLPLTYAVFGCDLHGQLQRNKSLQDNALTAIVGEVLK
jgi:pimeloyl-ACP methyl ester carboxylesterase